MKTINLKLTALLLTMLIVGCSNDDDGAASVMSISAKSQTFTVNGINNCNTSSGVGSTLLFDIPYTSPAGSKINKLQIKTTVADGGSEARINTKFTDNNGTISWASCFRFGSQDWVEYEVILEAEDGSVSNPSKVRVNRPDGAN